MNAQSQAVAQVETIAAMMAAYEMDWDRFEELKGKAAEGHWVAGYNMPGYMPDNEPAVFEDFGSAKRYIIDELKRDEEQADTEEEAETICGFAEDVNLESGEFSAQCGNYVYWVTFNSGLADPEEQAELDVLTECAGDYADQDAAYDAIIEDPLSIEFRSDWVSQGEMMTRNEYRIVLCMGGPHVELRGEFDYRDSPCSVRVLFKDWGESGELTEFDRDATMSYVRMVIGE